MSNKNEFIERNILDSDMKDKIKYMQSNECLIRIGLRDLIKLSKEDLIQIILLKEQLYDNFQDETNITFKENIKLNFRKQDNLNLILKLLNHYRVIKDIDTAFNLLSEFKREK